MHFFPILATLRRHRAAAALIVLEIALTCAIVCNTIFLIGERLARIDTPMLLATFALAVLSSLLAGILPAWRGCQVSPAIQLKSH